ncbi:alpha/beta fold hydrolase [Streptomyces sp. NPDC059224]|uniref:alpha/beta fold hydrolase n=1 Tax=Streptomyces sp. NPDC059224 TaxID=3346775 RepID=UPI0036AE7E95
MGSINEKGNALRFVLIHGTSHGAWCFERLTAALAARGHVVHGVELPGHAQRVAEPASAAGYRDAVMETIQPGDVLVGHSMGAWVMTLAADTLPDVRHLVYLAGPLPVDGVSMLDSLSIMAREPDGQAFTAGSEPIFDYHTMSPDGASLYFEPDSAKEAFYHDCDPHTASWAAARLTPQPLAPLMETVRLSNFWDADIPRSFIQCDLDRMFPPRCAEVSAERLGVRPLHITSSHSPFLSRPQALAQLLERAVDTPAQRPPRPSL